MARNKNPETLVRIVLDFLSGLVTSHSTRKEVLLFLRENLHPHLLEQFLSKFLLDPLCDSDLQIDCLLYLFNEHCRSLKFSFTDKRYYAQIVALLLKDQLKLEELNLYGVWLQDNIKADLVLALKKLDHLTQLSLPHIADDAIIHAISRSCPKLRHLDVLLYLNLGGAVGDTLGLSAVGEIVNYVPNLSSLGSFPFVVKAVHYIWENYECSDQLKLRYLHDRATDPQQLDQCLTLIPNVRSCYLDSPKPVTLTILPQFVHLNKVKLSRVQAVDIHGLVLELPRLTGLELVCARGFVDLFQIGSALPRLDTLEIYYSEYVQISSWAVEFAELKKLVIYSTESHLCAKPLLKACPNLEKVTLCDCSDVTDQEVFNIVDAGCLSRCQEIYWLNAPLLTLQSVWTLITLPSMRVIGKLDEWLVNPFEATELEDEIQHYNLDVKLYGKPKGTFIFEQERFDDVF
ncbi:uncharacterized protein LOC131883249 isoform X2 [Tigriopus californicus]|uniref:uncharacterized protein LOC131883249 isoform X2 n=1 Tax=Tigriopus californicus TaxID=6832 RepID=UPI0027DAAFA1|nr:uncharacterized protein LOC131883249 isoform X2 [Tigriopus californicus]